MKRFLTLLVALLALIAPSLTRAAPPIYPGVVPYEQLDTRNFELADYPILRIMPFMPRGAPPYLAVDTWSFAINTNNWFLYGFNPLNNTWNLVSSPLTINPTDNYSPYRINGTTFGDSMLRYRVSGSDLGAPTAGGGTSVYIGATGVFNVGLEAGQNGDFTDSLNVFNYGYRAGQNGIWDAVASSYNLGTDAGSNMTMLPGANNIYSFGDLAGSSAIYKVSSEIYNFGVYAGASSRSTNSYEIYNFGADAGMSMIASNSFDIYNIGSDANKSQTFVSKSHMFALGSGSTTTNTGDFVLGDSLYHYWLPGEIYSELAFGPGRTNVLYRTGTELVYTNGAADVKLAAVNGAGNGANLEAQGTSAVLSTHGGSVAIVLRANTDQVTLTAGGFYPVTDLSLLSGNWHYAWKDTWTSNLFVRGWTDPATDTNYIRRHDVIEDTIAVFDIQAKTNDVNAPITGYSFRTNGVEILSITGPGGGGILSQLLWTNSPTGAGTMDAGSSNVIASLPTGLDGATLLTTEDVFAAGENTGQNMVSSQSTNLYNIGLLSGSGMAATNAWFVLNLGDGAGQTSIINDSQDVYNFGLVPGESATITNGSWVVMNIGDNSGYAMVLDKSQDVFNYGWLSGESMASSNSIAIFNYGDMAGRAGATILDSEDIFNYGYDAGAAQNLSSSTNLLNYGIGAGQEQQMSGVSDAYNYGTFAGFMRIGKAQDSQQLYNYGYFSGASLAALVADGTFLNFTNIYNYGYEAGMQIKGTNANLIFDYGSNSGQEMTVTNVSNLFNYGSDTGYRSLGINASELFNYGVGSGSTATNVDLAGVYNYGNASGKQQYLTNASYTFSYGESAGFQARATNGGWNFFYGDHAASDSITVDSSDVFHYGYDSGRESVIGNSRSIFSYGHEALYQAHLTNSSEFYAYGNGAGAAFTGDGYTNIYLFGPAQPTRKTNEFAFANTNYLYTFPGDIKGNVPNAINVMAQPYGAKGDGVTDDYAAIQGAINAVRTNGGTVFFPTGTFNIATPLELTNSLGVRLVGASRKASVIQYAGTGLAMLDFRGATYATIKDLDIHSSGNVNYPGCIILFGRTSAGSAGYHTIQDATIRGYSTNASIVNIASELNTIIHSSISSDGAPATNVIYFSQSPTDLGYPGMVGSTMLSCSISEQTDLGNLNTATNCATLFIESRASTGDISMRDSYLAGAGGMLVQIHFEMSSLSGGPFVFDHIRGEALTAALKYAIVLKGSGGTGSACSGLRIENFDTTGYYGFNYWLWGADDVGIINSVIGPNSETGNSSVLNLTSSRAQMVRGNFTVRNAATECFLQLGDAGLYQGSIGPNSAGNLFLDQFSYPAWVWLPPIYNSTGIGTNAPSQKLEVVGNIKATGKALLKAGIQDGYTNVLTSATGKDFLYVSVPNTNGIGGHVVYTVFATDGTDVQEISGDCKFAAVAKATAVTATTADVQTAAAVTGGSTLTAALAANTATNNVFALGVTATTSLTTTNLTIRWRLETPNTMTVNAIP